LVEDPRSPVSAVADMKGGASLAAMRGATQLENQSTHAVFTVV